MLACAVRLPFRTAKTELNGLTQKSSVPALDVMVWQSTPENNDGLVHVIESISALNPDIEIALSFPSDFELELGAAIDSANPPDVFLVTGSMLPGLVEDGIVAPIPDGWIDEGQLLKSAAAAISVQGRQYCFPHSIHTLALLYNREMFDAADVEYPTSNWTWADLASAAARLTNVEDALNGLVLDPDLASWIPFYLQAGGEMPNLEEDGFAFSAAPAEEASVFFAQIFSEGSARTAPDLDASWSGEAFASGKAAMTIGGDWLVPYLDSDWPELRYGAAELPAGPARKATVAFTNCVAIAADSPHRDLALQLAAQLTAPEILSTWSDGGGEMSIYAEQDVARAQARTEYVPFMRSLRYAHPWRLGQYSAEHANRFADAVEQVVAGDITPGEFWPRLLRVGAVSTSR